LTSIDGILADENKNFLQEFLKFNEENKGFLDLLANILLIE
jgi:hypothetical protein